MKPYRNFFSYVLCCALLASGCGSRSGSSSSSSGSSSGGSEKIATASELVTEADARRILGGPVKMTTNTTNAKESVCIYLRIDKDQVAQLYVTIRLFPTEEAVKYAYETSTKYSEGRMVAGIGDEAQVAVRDANVSVFARKKRTLLMLTTVGSEYIRPSPDEMKSLAKRVAEQL